MMRGERPVELAAQLESCGAERTEAHRSSALLRGDRGRCDESAAAFGSRGVRRRAGRDLRRSSRGRSPSRSARAPWRRSRRARRARRSRSSGGRAGAKPANQACRRVGRSLGRARDFAVDCFDLRGAGLARHLEPGDARARSAVPLGSLTASQSAARTRASVSGDAAELAAQPRRKLLHHLCPTGVSMRSTSCGT